MSDPIIEPRPAIDHRKTISFQVPSYEPQPPSAFERSVAEQLKSLVLLMGYPTYDERGRVVAYVPPWLACSYCGRNNQAKDDQCKGCGAPQC